MEDTRSAQDSSSDTMDQSDDSMYDSNGIHRDNSVTMLLSKLEESRELVKDCYEDKDAVEQCNDVCCRGSYLDLVGPFIRPAIPSLDKSVSMSTNKDEDSLAEGDTKSCTREYNFNSVVDLTVNKNMGRNGSVRQTAFQSSPKQNNTITASSPNVNGMFQTSPKETHNLQIFPNGENQSHLSQMPLNGQESFLTPTNGKRLLQIPQDENNKMSLTGFQQPSVQMPILRNNIQSTNNDFVYNGERLVDLGVLNKLNNNHTETIVPSHHTEVLSKSMNGNNESQSVLRNQLSCETNSLRAAMSNNVSLENGFKRKLCSRVPECKLRTLLEADSNNMPSFIGEKTNVSVKQEPEDSSIQRSPILGENGVNGEGTLETGIDMKQNHLG